MGGFVEPIKDLRKFEKMLELLITDGKYREFLLLNVLYHTNLRISDALLIKWNDLITYENDQEWYVNEYFRINEKKTGKIRDLPVTNNFQHVIEKLYIKYHPPYKSWLFRSFSNRTYWKNKPWDPSYCYTFMKEYGKRAGIRSKIGTHTPRKTWGYHAYRNDTDVFLIQRIMNHSDVRTTEVYIGIDRELRQKTHEMVSGLVETDKFLIDLPESTKPKRKKRNTSK